MGEATEVFALDIGTRTVIGLVAKVDDDNITVEAAEVIEHNNRSMIDGQIHDVTRVAGVVQQVKESLEKRLGRVLSRVSAAAAGRALKTCRGFSEQEYSIAYEFTSDEVVALEVQAVQNCLGQISQDTGQKEGQYHCVGFSVVGYYLDGQLIGNLVGQRGYKAGVEVIATFLPRVVVDSLYSVLRKTNLELTAMTLEPIAASYVVIPEGMRHLNLALLDVGAGTTDIAVSASGTIIGFDMVPCAGDEMTEALCCNYLVDFMTGETIKRSLKKGQKVSFQDILGVTHHVDSDEAASCMEPVIRQLGSQIREKIITINGKLPQAVICIGGGSLAYKFPGIIAEELDIPVSKVAVRGRDALKNVLGAEELNGPAAITPIGIAATAHNNQALEYCKVQVNGMPVVLFNSKGARVLDALVASGMKLSEIYGKPGMGLSVEINGQTRFIRGGSGTSSKIRIDDHEASLDSEIKSGDQITIVPGTEGSPGRERVKDVIDLHEPKTVQINGKEYVLNPLIKVNGSPAEKDQWLEDKDKVEVVQFNTVKDLFNYLKVKDFTEYFITVDNETADPDTPIHNGSSIEFSERVSRSINVNVNGRDLKIPAHGGKSIFSDILPLIEFSPKPEKSKRLVMKINGIPATFTHQVKEGDRINIEWK